MLSRDRKGAVGFAPWENGTAVTVEEVLEQNESKLMSVPGVMGVGIGGTEEQPEIVVMVASNLTELRNKLPNRLNGFPVKVELSGEIRAL